MRRMLQITISLLLTSIFSFSQNLQNANWCFGANAKVDFNTLPPVVSSCAITPNVPITGTDVASVSNDLGQLQFYTNGRTVWNAANTQIGTGLYGYNHRGVMHQYLAIVPKPGSNSLYYLFTGSSTQGNLFNPPAPEHQGIFYSVIDMAANGGNGAIVVGQKNIPLRNHNNVVIDYGSNTSDGVIPEYIKVTTTLNEGGDGIWVVYYVMFEEAGLMKRYAYSYLVKENGINNTQDGTSPSPSHYTPLDNHNYPGQVGWSGPIKISPNGNYLCDAGFDVVNLYQFNDQTGAVSFDRNIYSNTFPENAGYGLEFSPNSQYVYFTTYDGTIYQGGKGGGSEEPADLSLVKIYQHTISLNESKVIGQFTVDNTLFPVSNTRAFGLQRAIDDKIYVCVSTQTQGNGWLGAIRQPNLFFTACDFVPAEVQLLSPNIHFGHLPQWVHKVREIWPKVYLGDKYTQLYKDNGENIYLELQLMNISTNLNHSGFIPPPTSFGMANTLQFNINSGITNWVKDKPTNFVFNSGVVQLYNSIVGQNEYFDGTTGVQVPPPVNLLAGHRLLIEKSANEFIAAHTVSNPGNVYTDLHLYQNNTIVATYTITYVHFVKYNPASKKLFIFRNPTNSQIELTVFDLSTNTFAVDPNTNPYILLNVSDELVQIDNQDNIYVVNNGILKSLDYVNGVYNNVSISGFINTNLLVLGRYNNFIGHFGGGPYTNNACLIGNSSEGKIYFLDFLGLSQRYIQAINFLDPSNPWWTSVSSNYIIDGSSIFIAGSIHPHFQGNVTLGSQQINHLSSNGFSNFITKFNLMDDFESRQVLTIGIPKKSEELLVFPNPAQNSFRARLSSSVKSAGIGVYRLFIFDQANNIILQNTNYTPNQEINISTFKTGVYYIEILTRDGFRFGRPFIKF